MYSVYVFGYVANFGTKVLIENKIEELSMHFSKLYLMTLIETIDKTLKDGFTPSLSFVNDKIIDSLDIAKGGLLTALWKLCDRNKWGLKYNLRRVPILQGSIEIANYYNLNPYRLLTGNAKLIILDKNLNEFCDYIVKIGDIVDSKKRVRIDGETEAFLTKDYKDEIDKVIFKETLIKAKL